MAVTAVVAAVGLSAAGSVVSASAASKSASAQEDVAQSQQQANDLSRQAMELDAHRRQLEVIRQGQVARSMATTNATAQNAQLGSGLQGGYAEVAGMEGTNLLGINQNLTLGEENFNIQNRISQDRMTMAQAGGLAAWGQGLSGLGGSIMSGYGAMSRLSQGWGSGNTWGPEGRGV